MIENNVAKQVFFILFPKKEQELFFDSISYYTDFSEVIEYIKEPSFLKLRFSGDWYIEMTINRASYDKLKLICEKINITNEICRELLKIDDISDLNLEEYCKNYTLLL